MVHLLVTTPYNLTQIAKKELQYHWYHNKVISPTMLSLEADIEAISKINIRSRIANKVYLVLQTWTINTFDEYFDCIHDIDRKYYIKENQPIITLAQSYHSILTHTPTLQSMAKKAITTSLTWSDSAYWSEDENIQPLEVQIFIIQNYCYVCINTSWESLHKRWYREETGDAPIKENVAAALVMMSNWTYHLPFLDCCCGSGTICIEAALIAKNKAPGLTRSFAFEQRSRYDHTITQRIRDKANVSIIQKSHHIVWSDNDPSSLQKAAHNMNMAWLWNSIERVEKSCQSYTNTTLTWTLVTNPPYGHRLHPDDLDEIYRTIAGLYDQNDTLTGWCISGYADAELYFPWENFNRKQLYNGAQEAVWYYKKTS